MEPAAPPAIVAVDASIAGNRLLNDVIGRSVLGRFDRDVLGQTGASFAVLLVGLNDIAFSEGADDPADVITADQLILGLEQLVRKANSFEIRVMGAMLTPFKGVGGDFYSEKGEMIRRTVNSWIRSTPLFDGFADFDRALRDPDEPARLRADFDSGDHVHPNDLGYQAMVDAIDISIFDRANYYRVPAGQSPNRSVRLTDLRLGGPI